MIFAKLNLQARRVLNFLLLTHNFICESHHQSLRGNSCWAFPETKPPFCYFKQSTAAQPVLPITVHDCVRKKSTFKKILKTENGEATSGKREAACCYRPQLIFLGACPEGLNSLYSKKWFQLTRCECPKWVTAVNSISAICCPLGHFWTAAWLPCQLLTGNVAWSDSVSEGEGGREREGEGERENRHASSQRRLKLFFSIDYGGNNFWRSGNLSVFHILSVLSFIFLMKLGWDFISKRSVLLWKPVVLGMSPYFHFFKKDIHLIFQMQKWIFPWL